jgi:hypothetical protein
MEKAFTPLPSALQLVQQVLKHKGLLKLLNTFEIAK